MSSFKLFFSVVPHGKGEKLTRAAMESGCRGGTVLMGRSLAKTNLVAMLGLGENSKDMANGDDVAKMLTWQRC